MRAAKKIASDNVLKKPKKIVALIYDFDGTLSPGNMQEYDFIPAIGMGSKEFWGKCTSAAQKNNADRILAYMRTMLKEAEAKSVPVRRSDFENFGRTIKYFDGVETWFERINLYARERGFKAEHYIISSGLKEMLSGTTVYKYFKNVFASSFVYNHNEVADWPATAINYTSKTQYLFRINKDVSEEYNDHKVNAYMPDKCRPVPFEHMIYIGDGLTDVPCMKLVKEKGGFSVAVYAANKKNARREAAKLIDEGRVHYAIKADYTPNSCLETLVKNIVNKIACDYVLKHQKQFKGLSPKEESNIEQTEHSTGAEAGPEETT